MKYVFGNPVPDCKTATPLGVPSIGIARISLPPVFLPPRLADDAFLRFLLPGFKPEPAVVSGPNASSCPSQIHSLVPAPASASSSCPSRDSYRRTPTPFLNPSNAACSTSQRPAMAAPNAGDFAS